MKLTSLFRFSLSNNPFLSGTQEELRLPQHQHCRDKRARRQKANRHPQRQEQAHLRAKADIRERPHRGRHHQRDGRKGHRLARGGQILSAPPR